MSKDFWRYRGRSMNDAEIEAMVRDAIDRSLAEENRTLAHTWLDRQFAIAGAVYMAGLIDPDELKGGSE